MNCPSERQGWRIEGVQLPRKVIMVNSVWVHREASPCRITSYWAGAEQALGQRGSLLFITPSVEDKQGKWTWEQGCDYFTGRLLTTKDSNKSLNISKTKSHLMQNSLLLKLWNNKKEIITKFTNYFTELHQEIIKKGIFFYVCLFAVFWEMCAKTSFDTSPRLVTTQSARFLTDTSRQHSLPLWNVKKDQQSII